MKNPIKLIYRETVYANAWLVPLIMALVALAMSGIVFLLSSVFANHFGLGQHFGYEPARTILVTLVSVIVALLSIAVSMTVVMLSISASQIGPRLLKNIMKQSKIQLCLGFLIASFVYCVASLLVIKWDDFFLITLVLGFFLTIADAFILIYLVDYVRKSIQLDSIIVYLGNELIYAIDHCYEKKTQASEKTRLLTPLQQSAIAKIKQSLQSLTLLSEKTGYIQTIDYPHCLDLACQHHCLIDIQCRLGDYIWEDLPIMVIWHKKPLEDVVLCKLRKCFYVQLDRSTTQDVEYGFEQLAEVAIRALSPSLTNPFTAINSIHRIFYGLTFLMNYHCPPAMALDEQQVIRLIINAPDYHCIVKAAFDRLRQQAKTDFLVTKTLLNGIGKLLSIPGSEVFRDALLAQADAIYTDAHLLIKNTVDKAALEIFLQQVKRSHPVNPFFAVTE